MFSAHCSCYSCQVLTWCENLMNVFVFVVVSLCLCWCVNAERPCLHQNRLLLKQDLWKSWCPLWTAAHDMKVSDSGRQVQRGKGYGWMGVCHGPQAGKKRWSWCDELWNVHFCTWISDVLFYSSVNTDANTCSCCVCGTWKILRLLMLLWNMKWHLRSLKYIFFINFRWTDLSYFMWTYRHRNTFSYLL